MAASRTGVFAGFRSCPGGGGGCVLGLLGACRAGCGSDDDYSVIVYHDDFGALFDDDDGFPDYHYHDVDDLDDVDDFPGAPAGPTRSARRGGRVDVPVSAHAYRGAGFGLGSDPVEAVA